jgi:hypothetical protein
LMVYCWLQIHQNLFQFGELWCRKWSTRLLARSTRRNERRWADGLGLQETRRSYCLSTSPYPRSPAV